MSVLNNEGLKHVLQSLKNIIPTKTSELTNDSGYLNSLDLTIDTNAASGTDYEIYTALNSLGWTTDVTAE